MTHRLQSELWLRHNPYAHIMVPRLQFYNKFKQYVPKKCYICTMIDKMDKYQIPYTNLCIRKFAERYSLGLRQAFEYLYKFGGLDFLVRFYDIEHTLPIEDTIDEIALTCATAGGKLQ